MKRGEAKRSRKIIRLLLIPILLLVFLQSALSFGTVIFSGTFSSLRNFAASRLEQVTETRQIILEGKMTNQWNELTDEYSYLNEAMTSFINEKGIDVDEFLNDTASHEEFFERIFATFIYLERTNATTGAFITLVPEGIETTGGKVSALYIRDGDPDSNPSNYSDSPNYSDLSLVVGPKSISQKNQIWLDKWKSELTLMPRDQRESDNFIYIPYLSAKNNPADTDEKNHCYWSRVFRLEDNDEDSYYMITYSIPLITDDGKVWGVIGVDISLTYLAENLPDREVESQHRGGYLLLQNTGEGNYHIIFASGPTARQLTLDTDEIFPASTDTGNLYKLTNNGQKSFLTLKPLRLYNTNTPHYDNGWYIAGIEESNALFGISDRLSWIFIIATLFSLVAAIVCALLLVRFVTNPIRRLSTCIQQSTENELKDFEPSHIVEVDELYDTIKHLTDRQKQIEFDLMEEKEKYHVALQSSSDILISHNLDNDITVFHNLRDGDHEQTVKGFLTDDDNRYIHPDDRRVVWAQLGEAEDKVSVSFRIDFSGKAQNYRWYELNGTILSAQDGSQRTLIGAMHDIHDQKMQEMAAYESLHRDSLTGLYRRSSGENIVRNSIQTQNTGCIILFDISNLGALNAELGTVAGNLVLEEFGGLLARIVDKEINNATCLRLGGNEFLVWLENYDADAAQKVAETIIERTKKLYDVRDFELTLASACARLKKGEQYFDLLSRACVALKEAKSSHSDKPIWASKEPYSTKAIKNIITPVEFSSSNRNIVSLTFSMFDKGGKMEKVAVLLFPKLGRELGASDIILTRINRDFFTVSSICEWHERDDRKREDEIVHYSAEEFASLQAKIGTDTSSVSILSELNESQCRFLRAPANRQGVAFHLYDSGNYIGSLIFVRTLGKELWDEEERNKIYEVVKVIESNLNRQRYDAASRAKSDFLSRMSHEIRTPMNAIIGMTYLAKNHVDDKDALDSDLQKIDQSSHYLLGLINDILDMSRIESGKMTIESTAFDLTSMLNGVGDLIAPQAKAKRIKYITDFELTNDWVKGDVMHIKQVLVNLLGNAVKFTPEEGNVTLTVRQSEDMNIFFSVKDTGIGVSPENRERIFRSFEQAESSTVRQYGGTGLGLSISSRLVQLMGGAIDLKSELGKGSDFFFTIRLPFDEEHEQRSEEQSDSESDFIEPEIEGVKILLVEDNELNIEIAQSILEMYGAKVTLAHNGQEAVDTFVRSQKGDFDLILMDIQMPVMDGLEATKRIRNSAHPSALSIPIIAMTANAFDEDMKRSVESGMNGHLSKPLDVSKLLKTIAESVEKKD